MNPLTNVKNITKLNEREITLGVNDKSSWHNEYKDSAWIFVGGLDYGLTEGDIICVFSQYGELVNINFLRDKKTGKPKGYCFLCYEDQRSTILAVDNFNGIKLCNRTIRVDHVANYRPPKDDPDLDEITKRIREEGCAPRIREVEHLKTEKMKTPKPKVTNDNTTPSVRDGPEQMPVVKTEKRDPGYEKHEIRPSSSRHVAENNRDKGMENRRQNVRDDGKSRRKDESRADEKKDSSRNKEKDRRDRNNRDGRDRREPEKRKDGHSHFDSNLDFV